MLVERRGIVNQRFSLFSNLLGKARTVPDLKPASTHSKGECLEQQSNYLRTKHEVLTNEQELRLLLEHLYLEAKNAKERGTTPKFYNLLEYISSSVTIQTATHNIKSNKGANTPGTDGINIRMILQQPYDTVIESTIDNTIRHQPIPIRREHIPKPGKKETRPLGIPASIDKITQECVKIIIEPILEAQFFDHSYGFRPMRDTHMAMERVTSLVHTTGYHWIVEGDIRNYFGTINHNKLLGQLWHLGIRDTRVLKIIKEMLEAGVMDEMDTNTIGTQQGGVIL